MSRRDEKTGNRYIDRMIARESMINPTGMQDERELGCAVMARRFGNKGFPILY